MFTINKCQTPEQRNFFKRIFQKEIDGKSLLRKGLHAVLEFRCMANLNHWQYQRFWPRLYSKSTILLL